MIEPLQIVVDTNVLIAGLRSKRGASYKLLTLLNNERWQLNVSVALVLEYEAILKREQMSLSLTSQDIDDLIEGICAIANKRSIFFLWRPLTNDPNDDFLLELAMESQADFLITYNQRDLQPVETFGIRVVTPKVFLQEVGEIL